jgi:hypothetical protein
MPHMHKFLVFIALCSAPASAGDFFPLQTGNEWSYRESRTGDTRTVRVSTPVVMNDRSYYTLIGYATERLFVRQDEAGNLLAVDPETYREQILTQFEAVDRSWWNAPFRICEQEGQAQKERVAYNGPAGAIHQTLEIRYRSFGCADAGVESEHFAENIGMLRRVELSIAGPRTYELVSARIGRQTIQTDQQGGFTVSVRELPGGKELEIRMELTLEPSGETRLQFYSGQHYDAIIRNASGHVAWQWSAGMMFTQGLSERVIAGRWVITLKAPRPEVNLPGSNRFVVEAWLPTVGGNQFAAATPFALSTPGN